MRVEVFAGPDEATALGNAMIQAIADGRFSGLEEARVFLSTAVSGRRFVPSGQESWSDARARYARIESAAAV